MTRREILRHDRLSARHLMRAAERDATAADALLLSAGAVARQLGVSGRTVRRWIEAGKCDAIQTQGGHYRIARAELARLTKIVGQSGHPN